MLFPNCAKALSNFCDIDSSTTSNASLVAFDEFVNASNIFLVPSALAPIKSKTPDKALTFPNT